MVTILKRRLFWMVGAWLVFAGGLVGLMLIDHTLRMTDGDVRSGGFHRTLWFEMHSVLGFVGFSMLLFGSTAIERLWLRVSVFVAQIALGVFLYIFGCLAYVIGTGIDYI